MIIQKRTDYKYSLVRAVVSLRTDTAPFKDISLGPKGRFPKERTPDGARFPTASVYIDRTLTHKT